MTVPDDERHVLRALSLLMDESRQLILRNVDGRLRPSQLRVIGSVPGASGITVTALAIRVGMTKQAIGQFVTQLTEDGFLVSDADPEDRRVRVVRRTPAADDALRHLAVRLAGLEADWERRVGKHRSREFRAALDEIAGLA
ncbi:MarR family winged helix-turn-helix transcriptional regulator [Lapillicoccus sp.]|uniref:MarR family winged helix-turn-helix transcriptional regulator n=1 Tax=Lapillicoccus sp. TaxID=1909287 RepID=UPI0025FEDD4D|nr:MarR family winged helix-turn-helix transcriptional regulator [Lapillicoccus sp.]